MSEEKAPSKPVVRAAAINPISVAEALLVADHRSFRRAAAVLGVRQSGVSRRVRALEDELGVSLFERHHAGVRVTNAGARFFEEAREALLQLDHAVKAAAAAGSGSLGQLSIGILSSIGVGYLRDLIHTYCVRHPNITVQLLENASEEHIGLIRRRRLDVALIMDTTDVLGCDTATLWSERLFVALPKGHALRNRNTIEWHDLTKENLIVRQSERNPVLCTRLTKRLIDQDQLTNVRKLNVGRETLMHLVAIGQGVGLTSESTIATPFPNVIFRPIAGEDELLQFCAVWLPQNDNPALRRFLSMARTMARAKRPDTNPLTR